MLTCISLSTAAPTLILERAVTILILRLLVARVLIATFFYKCLGKLYPILENVIFTTSEFAVAGKKILAHCHRH